MKKRVHEIAKEQGITSKDLLEKLHAAGIDAKAAASSIDEAAALKVLGSNGASAPTAAKTDAPSPPPSRPPKFPQAVLSRLL